MKTNMSRNLLVLAALALGGCASNTDLPLIFGASNTIGISMGGSVPEQGGDLTIGYKGQDFALVPVTVVQPDGTESQIGGSLRGEAHRDAYSVLGQFEASASNSNRKTSLGKFFATGLAAKKLSDGFASKLGLQNTAANGCSPKPQPQKQIQETPYLEELKKVSAQQLALQDEQRSLQQAQAALQKSQPANSQQAGSGSAPGATRSGAVMVFAQYGALGFSVGATAAQQGGDLTLGWKDRNVAIVPVVARDAAGRSKDITAKVTNRPVPGENPVDQDALSVLGQFEFDSSSESGATQAGLGKFFSTGVAAQKLSDGFKVKLCEEYEPVKKSDPQTKPKPEEEKPEPGKGA